MRFHSAQRCFCLSLLGLAPFLSAGCNKEPERLEISGTVKFKNRLLERGMITFVGASEEGIQTGAVIMNGSYALPKTHGLMPGKYKVMIRSAAAGGASGEDAGDPGKEAEEPIPAKYNAKTELEIELKKEGPFTFDFDLKEK